MSMARSVAFSLLAGLFALASSGPLAGQSLTRARSANHAPTATAAVLQPPSGPAEDDTPWGFFRKNIKHADSLTKWLALIFPCDEC
jgi:hypothetical protein